MKTHTTAVALVPPQHVWEPIQAIRREHDRHVQRWMPHVNLLYPFRPREEFDAALPLVTRACSSLAPFALTLREARFFSHGRGRFTVWLAPEPSEPLIDLHARLRREFPDCDDLSRRESGFTPHLSVGQAQGRAALEALLGAVGATWRPLELTVDSISVIQRRVDEPFRVIHSVPLGGLLDAST